ncbi:hypothetical protein GCM10007913_11800 [Devosia yakushimensis]|uniref:DUF4332 domain-containing protein n=1 Tax=Devosia yakushimensis TaxID=470028 RepID=A0ABQ5UBA4_9HYPH|nr:hypothetical protein [Devosia yakushimensis]GLQ09248.1 hypothetical protein GCM10007913_11800 [Devosia yakushimensis]
MPLIQCLPGPTETTVGGDTYVFTLDRERRAVAQVHNLVHVQCLLAVVHYKEVEPLAEPKPPAVPADIVVPPPPTATVIPAPLIPAPVPVVPPAPAVLTADERAALYGGVVNPPVSEIPPPAKPPIEPPETNPPAEPPPAAEPPAPDNLELIGGVGPSVAAKLNGAGITTFAQIVALDATAIEKLNTDLDLRGSIVRNDWIGQAKELIAEKAQQQE